jgi:hypothetical protein
MSSNSVEYFTDKLDKKAELEKLEKQEQERVDREEELREMTSKLKHRYEFKLCFITN